MTIDRRTALAGLTAATAGSIGLGRAADGAQHRPPRLREGDTVGLIAPASWIADLAALERMEATIRSFGLVPKRAANVLARDGYFAGPDRERAAAVNALYADPEVRALWSANGGWGCQRILPFLDYRTIEANPKLLIGSSDVTALHMALAARTHCPTIHGPNAAHSWGTYPRECFRRLLFDAVAPTYGPLPGTEPAPSSVRTIRPGKARGRLLGGNLSVLSAMVGTGYLPDFRGAILFLEDTNEAEYRIDRMLTQLEQAGILRVLAGVVFGQCTNCRNPVADYSGYTIDQVLYQHFAGLGVPVYQGALIGHIAQHISVPEGAMAEIDATAGILRVVEPVVQ